MKPSGSTVKLNLSSPIYQTPLKVSPSIPIQSPLYKAQRTVNLSPQRENLSQIKQAYEQNYKQVCCPNCRYLFKVSTISPAKQDWLEKAKNIRSIMVQTEVQIEMVSTQALIERISELEFKGKPTETSINLPDSPKKPEKQVQPQVQVTAKNLTETKGLKDLALSYSDLQQQLSLFGQYLSKTRNRPDIPAYLKYLDTAFSI